MPNGPGAGCTVPGPFENRGEQGAITGLGGQRGAGRGAQRRAGGAGRWADGQGYLNDPARRGGPELQGAWQPESLG